IGLGLLRVAPLRLWLLRVALLGRRLARGGVGAVGPLREGRVLAALLVAGQGQSRGCGERRERRVADPLESILHRTKPPVRGHSDLSRGARRTLYTGTTPRAPRSLRSVPCL